MDRGTASHGAATPRERVLGDVVARLHAFRTRIKSSSPGFQPADLTLLEDAKQALLRLDRTGKQLREVLEVESMKVYRTKLREQQLQVTWRRDYEALVKGVKANTLRLAQESQARLKAMQEEAARLQQRQLELAEENKCIAKEIPEGQEVQNTLLERQGEMAYKRLEKAEEMDKLNSALQKSQMTMEVKEDFIQSLLISLVQERAAIRRQAIPMQQGYNSKSRKLNQLKNTIKLKEATLNMISGKIKSMNWKILVYTKYLDENQMSLKVVTRTAEELSKRLKTAQAKTDSESALAIQLREDIKKMKEYYEERKKKIPTYQEAITMAEQVNKHIMKVHSTASQKLAQLKRLLREDNIEAGQLENELGQLIFKTMNHANRIGEKNYIVQQNQKIMHFIEIYHNLSISSLNIEMQAVQDAVHLRRSRAAQLMALNSTEVMRQLYELALEKQIKLKEKRIEDLRKIYDSLQNEHLVIIMKTDGHFDNVQHLEDLLSQCQKAYTEMLRTLKLKLATLVESTEQWQQIINVTREENCAIYSKNIAVEKTLNNETELFKKLTEDLERITMERMNLEQQIKLLLSERELTRIATTTMLESTMAKANNKMKQWLNLAGLEIIQLEQNILKIVSEIDSIKERKNTLCNELLNLEDETSELKQFHMANLSLLSKLYKEMNQGIHWLAHDWKNILLTLGEEDKMQQITAGAYTKLDLAASNRGSALQHCIQGVQRELQTMMSFLSAVIAKLRKLNKKKDMAAIHTRSKTTVAANTDVHCQVEISEAIPIEEIFQNRIPSSNILALKVAVTSEETLETNISSVSSSESICGREVSESLRYLNEILQKVTDTQSEQMSAMKITMYPHWECLQPPRPVSKLHRGVGDRLNVPRTKKHVYSCERLQVNKEEKMPPIIPSSFSVPRNVTHLRQKNVQPLPEIKKTRLNNDEYQQDDLNEEVRMENPKDKSAMEFS